MMEYDTSKMTIFSLLLWEPVNYEMTWLPCDLSSIFNMDDHGKSKEVHFIYWGKIAKGKNFKVEKVYISHY